MKRRFLPLAAIVLVPILIITGFALRGIEAQRRAAWTDAQDNARQLAEVRADRLSTLIESRYVRTAERFADPPVPSANVPAGSALAGDDLATMRTLRDNPEAGLTASGLPKRVIAAFRVYRQTRDPDDARALLTLATVDCPSVITPLAFDQVFDLPEDVAQAKDIWKGVKAVNEVLRRHPEIPENGTWLLDQGELWWIASVGGQIRFVALGAPSGIPVPRGPAVSSRPWETVRLTLGGDVIDGPDGVVLASKRVATVWNKAVIASSPALAVEVITPDSQQVHSSVTKQATTTLGVLGAAVLVALIGLVMIQRLMARERRLNELKSHFVASVSHELRAPVGSIRLMADALDAGKVSPETAADFHRLISREGKRLTNLIENVLDFARIEQGRKRWHFEAADLPALVADTLELMKPLAAEKRIALGFIHEVFDAEPVLDSAAVQQALVNLLDNAVKFSPPDSGIETILSSDDRCWRLAVRDHGAGIPSSERKKIFERFYRSGDELRRETQGTGIGLSLVKAIAEAHGGRVELESRPGQGSTFTLVIPLDATAGH